MCSMAAGVFSWGRSERLRLGLMFFCRVRRNPRRPSRPMPPERAAGFSTDLQGLVDDFATGLKRLDECRPQAANVRSGERYQPGIGPHTETQTLTLLAAEEAVNRAKRRLHARGARVTGTVCYGHAAAERLAAVHEFEPDLFVLGAKGRHSPPETELGHVARKVMDHVPCSTLIVRP